MNRPQLVFESKDPDVARERRRGDANELLDAEAACQLLRVHRNTLYRWLRDPVFCVAVQDVRGELRDAARMRLESMADKAALYAVLTEGATPDAA